MIDLAVTLIAVSCGGRGGRFGGAPVLIRRADYRTHSAAAPGPPGPALTLATAPGRSTLLRDLITDVILNTHRGFRFDSFP